MADEYTPEMLAMLERQIDYFRSDDRIREEVALWADATPEDRLAALAELGGMNEHFAAQLDDETYERLREHDVMPPDTLVLLERLRAGR